MFGAGGGTSSYREVEDTGYPVTYEVTAEITRAERWDLTREALRRLW